MSVNLPVQTGVYPAQSPDSRTRANNPVRYIDPDGDLVLPINRFYIMNDYKGIYVGNATSGKNHFEECGCYVTLLADIFASSSYYGVPLENADRYGNPLALNAESSLFEKGSSNLKWNVFEILFGQEDVKWEYWTRKNQKAEGLYEKLLEYEHSDKAVMIMGVFDLSSQTTGVSHHVVGLSGIHQMLTDTFIFSLL